MEETKMEKEIKKQAKKIENTRPIKTLKKSQPLTFLAILTAYGFIFLAWLSYPLGFSMKTNWISDLGNQILNPGAWYFNLGCIITGIFLIVLFFKNKSMVFGITGAIMSFSLICIGLVPEEIFFFHSFFADVFFKCCLICIIIAVISHDKGIRYFGIICILFSTIFLTIRFEPLFEWITFSLDFSFICIICYNSDQRR